MFHVRLEQLQARDGMVRCGQCTNAFRADQSLFDEIPTESPTETRAGSKRTRRGNGAAPATETAPSVRRAGRSKRQPAAGKKSAEAPRVRSSGREDKRPRREPGYAPSLYATEILGPSPIRRPPSALWIVASLLLTAVLGAQTAFFYRDTLAEYPQLRPFVVRLCQNVECTLRSSFDANRIELIQPTNIAPHPRIAGALRLRATLVNRAQRSQPFPLLEVTLTDGAGHALARRIFSAREYLEQPTTDREMFPNVAIAAKLDVSNPDAKAVGYQIEFVAPPVF